MSQEYKITNVQKRKEWSNSYGVFQDYALQLDGVDGWVSKSQKPDSREPQVGQNIYGSINTTTQGENTFYKFKSEKNPNFGGSNHSSSPASSANKEDIDYIIMMLEELTLRRQSPDEPQPRHKPDVLPTDDDMNKPFTLDDIKFDQEESKIDLSTIPFNQDRISL